MVEDRKQSLDCDFSCIFENESGVLSLETVGIIFTNPLAFIESCFEDTVDLDADVETALKASFPVCFEV